MTGQQLRNSILQEAIHGRLVPNVLQPGEKTARELLSDTLSAIMEDIRAIERDTDGLLDEIMK